MRIGPTNPFHIARAYGLGPATPPAAQASAEGVRAVAAGQTLAALARSNAPSRLVAGIVPGKVDFTTSKPAPRGSAMPLYRHPADRNAAATAVTLGRMIDVNG